MTEHRKPLSPAERFANLCDAISDDKSFDADVEVNEQSSKAAMAMMRAAMDEALATDPAAPQEPASKADAPTLIGLTRDNRPSSSYSKSLVDEKPLLRRFLVGWSGFAQIFGIHPATALLLSATNIVLDAVGWVTFGAAFALDLPILPVVGTIAYLLQLNWYRERNPTAILKALVLMCLTAIPLPMAAVFIPAGILGLFHLRNLKAQRRESTEQSDVKQTK